MYQKLLVYVAVAKVLLLFTLNFESLHLDFNAVNANFFVVLLLFLG